jgi:hypothetical protein
LGSIDGLGRDAADDPAPPFPAHPATGATLVRIARSGKVRQAIFPPSDEDAERIADLVVAAILATMADSKSRYAGKVPLGGGVWMGFDVFRSGGLCLGVRERGMGRGRRIAPPGVLPKDASGLGPCRDPGRGPGAAAASRLDRPDRPGDESVDFSPFWP